MKIVIGVILVILAAVVVVLVAQFKLIACGMGRQKPRVMKRKVCLGKYICHLLVSA